MSQSRFSLANASLVHQVKAVFFYLGGAVFLAWILAQVINVQIGLRRSEIPAKCYRKSSLIEYHQDQKNVQPWMYSPCCRLRVQP